MPTVEDILVIAATLRECAQPSGWRTLLCGVGPVDSAANTAAELARHRPALVLHVGIAGARRSDTLPPGTIVIGSRSHYCDIGVAERFAPNTLDVPAGLVDAARRALPSAVVLPIGTSARIGGTSSMETCDVEAMEGFGVLRAAQLAGVPAIEVRAISNEIAEADRARWHFDTAFAAIAAATPLLVAALLESINGHDG